MRSVRASWLVGMLLIMTTSLFVGTSVAVAQESSTLSDMLEPVTGEEKVDPNEAVQAILDNVQARLSADAVATLDNSERGETAQAIVNLLEGENGLNYDSSVAVEGDVYGAIPYLEDITDRSAANIKDPEAMVSAGTESPEVLALAHLVLADEALTGEQVDLRSAFDTAAHHVEKARSKLN